MSPETLGRIVSGIYTAASGVSEWHIPLQAMCHQMRAFAVQIQGLDKRTGTLLFSHVGGSISSGAQLDYARTYHRLDPRVQLVGGRDTKFWLNCHEYFDDDFVASDPFYQEFLIPYGARYVSGRKLLDTEDEVVIFAVLRAVLDVPFSPDEIAILQRIADHAEQAMQLFLHLRGPRATTVLGGPLLEGFRYPMILVNAERRIRYSNTAATAAIQSTEYILQRNGLIGCRDLRDDFSLGRALDALQIGGQSCNFPAPVDKAFVRTRKAQDGAPVGIHLIAVRPSLTMGAFGATPAALLIVNDPAQHPIVDRYIVAETFRLTPAEARVATGLASGETAKSLARLSGVSPGTVRTQIQAVYAKTGVTRQSDLVRVVLATARLQTPATR